MHTVIGRTNDSWYLLDVRAGRMVAECPIRGAVEAAQRLMFVGCAPVADQCLVVRDGVGRWASWASLNGDVSAPMSPTHTEDCIVTTARSYVIDLIRGLIHLDGCVWISSEQRLDAVDQVPEAKPGEPR